MSSPRVRATATAAAIVAALGRPATSIDLDERWAEADCGLAEGRTFAELEASIPDLAAALARGATEIDWPGGETAAALVKRVTAAWREVTQASRPVVIVSHAGPLRIALALASGVSVDTVAFLAPGEARRIELS